MARNRRKRHPRGLAYRKGLVVKKQHENLTNEVKAKIQEIKTDDAKKYGEELVNYDGKEHRFTPFWTRQPRAFTRAYTRPVHSEVN